MDAKSLERVLLERQLPELLPPEEGWVVPHYQGLSIANVPATIAALFDHQLPAALPPLPQELWAGWQQGLQRVVLVILDALGYRMLQRLWAAGLGDTLSGLALRNIGPAINSGRVVDFAVTPGTRHRYFAATASGGLWKTENAGTTWQPVFDGEGSYSIGCVTIDPNNPHVIWVGSG